ncbi:endonuclease/exonuclease/phosphatase family protein [Streptomyces kanamyceticus]|uniref:Endonuclease/exonuclease/phosphatase family protein n=1 Tax=Streptomyces kanamyceticus TaxID=1967 RepID=A0A5J6GWS9_STRKN|nr:endonuclease/exonuclease/phosphatase family protein [Streptomyces kanamyceticus]
MRDTEDEADGEAPRRVGKTAAWAAALLLGGVTAVIGFRVADSDGFTPVPQILAFLPWLLVPAGAGLLLAVLARWRVGMLWGVAALGLVAWYMEPYGQANDAKGAAVAELRVLTSNVEFGQGTPGLIRAVREERPDLLFVEECDHACAALLRKELPHADYPYRAAVDANGAEGSVILANVPLKSAKGIDATLGMPGAVADVRGHPVRIQLAHPMPPVPREVGLWRSELRKIQDYAAAGDGASTIVAGDFNATQDHAAFRDVLDAGLRDAARLAGSSRAPSWPAAAPAPLGAQIDHVLATPDFAARDARFLEIGDTDHRALVVTLTLHKENEPDHRTNEPDHEKKKPDHKTNKPATER